MRRILACFSQPEAFHRDIARVIHHHHLTFMKRKTFAALGSVLATVTLLAGGDTLLAATSPEAQPDDRDRAVLEAALLHLRDSKDFSMALAAKDGDSIVLHAVTPEKTGGLSSTQLRSDLRDKEMPEDVELSLRDRNSVLTESAQPHQAVHASYAKLKFGPGIVVTDLKEVWDQTKTNWKAFQQAHPKAKGYAVAYLPGYSADGNTAVVNGNAGPSYHGVGFTVLLEKKDGKWTVTWLRVVYYA
jgi:hypothetical protein